ncbi:MAG TPA: ADOP family duplicated permease, partial [Gemmatimonadales bacterium]|nr:ADOP family duplicated permease [Gemmatimonadales bacterium]
MSLFSDAVMDLRHGFRLLRHRPGFAFAAILPLALGLGAATAMYSILDGLLLRPPAFTEPDRLVAIWATEQAWQNDPTISFRWDRIVIGHGDFEALEERSRTLSKVAAWSQSNGMLGDADGGYSLANEALVSSSIFDLLGLHPYLGRTFRSGEDVLNGPAIAMLGYETWQRNFAGDPAIIGRSIEYGGKRFTVVGVMPPGIILDRAMGIVAVWVPAFQGKGDIPSQHNRSYRGLGRLRTGSTLAQANAEVHRIFADVKAEWHGSAGGTGGKAVSYQDDQTLSTRPTLLLLAGATGLLVLIACVNLAMLMLGDITRRQGELVARNALGAAPGRLSRQLLAETLAISASGAVLGIGVGWAMLKVLIALAPADIAGLGQVRFDLPVFGFVAVSAALAGVVAGVLPVVAILRWRRYGAGGAGYGQTPRGEVRVQRALVGAEVAISLVMLVGCSLLGRALLKLTAIDPGFASDGLITVDYWPPVHQWGDSAAAIAFNAAAVRELSAIPGVTAVSGSNSGLFNGNASSSPLTVVGEDPNTAPRMVAQHEVLPGYFSTLRVPVVQGRDFSESDNASASKVAIVSASEARRDFPGVSPVGKLVRWQGQELAVVGVVADLHYNKLDAEFQPTIYVPAAQWWADWMSFLVRGAPGSASLRLIPVIRDRLLAINPAIYVESVSPVPALVRRSYAEESYRTLLGTLFGIVGTVLAAFGMFGVVSRTVAGRMREAGIRSALGAPAASITTLMLRETAIGAAFGLGAGLFLAVWLAQV